MSIFHSFHLLAAVGLLVGLASACTQKNASHCANREGDKTCRDLYDTTPYCSECTVQNDGCVTSIADEAKCHVATEGDTNADTSSAATTVVDTTLTTSDESMTTHMSGSMSAGDTSTGDAATTNVDSSEGDASSSGGGPVCGNGVLEDDELWEDCDGDELGDATCVTLGYDGGTLTCTPQCVFDYSMCGAPTTCHNGQLDADEQCDEDMLTVPTCHEYTAVYGGGLLSCTATCIYDTSDCCVADLQVCNSETNCCSGNCLALACNPL